MGVASPLLSKIILRKLHTEWKRFKCTEGIFKGSVSQESIYKPHNSAINLMQALLGEGQRHCPHAELMTFFNQFQRC